ncbi:MAG: VOC family protein [Acidimicrobiales bacterium]
MAIRALNHAVLYVRDARRSASFYRDVLGFRTVAEMANGAGIFLQAPDSDNDHDLGLFSVGEDASPSQAGQGSVGLYHLAWEVGTLADLVGLRDRLTEAGALVGSSNHGTTKSLYAKDVDGIEFEVAWLIPHDLIDERDRAGQATTGRLDLDAELARFGPDTIGASS